MATKTPIGKSVLPTSWRPSNQTQATLRRWRPDLFGAGSALSISAKIELAASMAGHWARMDRRDPTPRSKEEHDAAFLAWAKSAAKSGLGWRKATQAEQNRIDEAADSALAEEAAEKKGRGEARRARAEDARAARAAREEARRKKEGVEDEVRRAEADAEAEELARRAREEEGSSGDLDAESVLPDREEARTWTEGLDGGFEDEENAWPQDSAEPDDFFMDGEEEAVGRGRRAGEPDFIVEPEPVVLPDGLAPDQKEAIFAAWKESHERSNGLLAEILQDGGYPSRSGGTAKWRREAAFAKAHLHPKYLEWTELRDGLDRLSIHIDRNRADFEEIVQSVGTALDKKGGEPSGPTSPEAVLRDLSIDAERAEWRNRKREAGDVRAISGPDAERDIPLDALDADDVERNPGMRPVRPRAANDLSSEKLRAYDAYDAAAGEISKETAEKMALHAAWLHLKASLDAMDRNGSYARAADDAAVADLVEDLPQGRSVPAERLLNHIEARISAGDRRKGVFGHSAKELKKAMEKGWVTAAEAEALLPRDHGVPAHLLADGWSVESLKKAEEIRRKEEGAAYASNPKAEAILAAYKDIGDGQEALAEAAGRERARKAELGMNALAYLLAGDEAYFQSIPANERRAMKAGGDAFETYLDSAIASAGEDASALEMTDARQAAIMEAVGGRDVLERFSAAGKAVSGRIDFESDVAETYGRLLAGDIEFAEIRRNPKMLFDLMGERAGAAGALIEQAERMQALRAFDPMYALTQMDGSRVGPGVETAVLGTLSRAHMSVRGLSPEEFRLAVLQDGERAKAELARAEKAAARGQVLDPGAEAERAARIAELEKEIAEKKGKNVAAPNAAPGAKADWFLSGMSDGKGILGLFTKEGGGSGSGWLSEEERELNKLKKAEPSVRLGTEDRRTKKELEDAQIRNFTAQHTSVCAAQGITDISEIAAIFVKDNVVGGDKILDVLRRDAEASAQAAIVGDPSGLAAVHLDALDEREREFAKAALIDRASMEEKKALLSAMMDPSAPTPTDCEAANALLEKELQRAVNQERAKSGKDVPPKFPAELEGVKGATEMKAAMEKWVVGGADPKDEPNMDTQLTLKQIHALGEFRKAAKTWSERRDLKNEKEHQNDAGGEKTGERTAYAKAWDKHEGTVRAALKENGSKDAANAADLADYRFSGKGATTLPMERRLETAAGMLIGARISDADVRAREEAILRKIQAEEKKSQTLAAIAKLAGGGNIRVRLDSPFFDARGHQRAKSLLGGVGDVFRMAQHQKVAMGVVSHLAAGVGRAVGQATLVKGISEAAERHKARTNGAEPMPHRIANEILGNTKAAQFRMERGEAAQIRKNPMGTASKLSEAVEERHDSSIHVGGLHPSAAQREGMPPMQSAAISEAGAARPMGGRSL